MAGMLANRPLLLSLSLGAIFNDAQKIFCTKHVFVDVHTVGVSLISDCVDYAGIAINTICIVSMSMNLIM